MRRRDLVAGLAVIPLAATGGSDRAASPDAPRLPSLRDDRLRPQFHLLPPANWMNDPCGPIFAGGLHHLFYQYNPTAPVWGDMHWGHATSPDLLHWTHRPPALSPRPGTPFAQHVFTGCTVLRDGVPTALFTAIPGGVQCVATSDDALLRWAQDAVPLELPMPPGIRIVGFRDPQVWRDGDGWGMVLGSGIEGVGGAVLLYRSDDFRSWRFRRVLHVFENGEPGGETCECPDFFPLGDRHVLLFSAAGRSHWVTGAFAGDVFTPGRTGTLDATGLYAAKSVLDPSGRRIAWGWILERRPVPQQQAAGWSGVMSLPKVLSTDADGRLRIDPLPELARLEGPTFHDGARGLAGTADGPTARIRARPAGAGTLAFGPGFVSIDYDPARVGRELLCNGLGSALPQPAPSFDILVDGSVIEVFCSDGTCLTARAYGDAAGRFGLHPAGGFASGTLHACSMTPISPDRLTS